MYTLFAALIIITCILLVLVILVQNPKGGGLSSTFGGGNQMFGVQKTTDFLDTATWTLAGVLLALTLLSNFAIDRGDAVIDEGSRVQEQVEGAGPIIQQAPTTGGAGGLNQIPTEGEGDGSAE